MIYIRGNMPPLLFRYWLRGKNELCDYLVEHTVRAAETYASGLPWTRVIWDVTAVAWLLNDNNRFMQSRVINKHISNYDFQYNLSKTPNLCDMYIV